MVDISFRCARAHSSGVIFTVRVPLMTRHSPLLAGDPVVWSDVGMARVLAGANRTRGSGSVIEDGWRELRWAKGQAAESCGMNAVSSNWSTQAHPSCVDGFLEAIGGYMATKCFNLSSCSREAIEPSNNPTLHPLQSGDLVQTPDGPLLIYLPDPPRHTDASLLSIVHPELKLDIDLQQLEATFTVGQKRSQSGGRMRAGLSRVCALRKAPEGHAEGWTTRERAHAVWVQLGGKAIVPRLVWPGNEANCEHNWPTNGAGFSPPIRPQRLQRAQGLSLADCTGENLIQG